MTAGYGGQPRLHCSAHRVSYLLACPICALCAPRVRSAPICSASYLLYLLGPGSNGGVWAANSARRCVCEKGDEPHPRCRSFRAVKQKTSDSRFSRGLKSISQWCRFNRHEPLAVQHHTLCQKLRGHNAYYGITGNSVALPRFRWFVTAIWRKWLSRRRRRGTIPWDQFYRLLGRYPLPPPVAIHSVYRTVASS